MNSHTTHCSPMPSLPNSPAIIDGIRNNQFRPLHLPRSPLPPYVNNISPLSPAASTRTSRSKQPLINDYSIPVAAVSRSSRSVTQPQTTVESLPKGIKHTLPFLQKNLDEHDAAERGVIEANRVKPLVHSPFAPTENVHITQMIDPAPSFSTRDTPLPVYVEKEKYDERIVPELCFLYGFVFFPLWIMGGCYLYLGLDEKHNPGLLKYPPGQRDEVRTMFRSREKRAAKRCLFALAILFIVIGIILIVHGTVGNS
ncbi:hypothetical protein FRB93_001044 [Tulasnella sp. JGI-2019a]|nr:hypothetical protein FRB93_001044 [Tulasnella sp. JGI-2019a]